MIPTLYRRNLISHQQGFSMIEILITLVIIATALFGTAGLQAYAMLMGQSSQFRTQAIFLASDYLDRIEANKNIATGVVAGNYVIAGNGAPPALTTPDPCIAAPCTAAQLANRDINQWENDVALLLPQPTWSVTRAGATYTVVLGWTDRSNTAIPFSYTAVRSIGK